MKIVRKHKTRRLASLFKLPSDYFRAEVSSLRDETASVLGSLFASKRRAIGVLLVMVAAFSAVGVYAATTQTPVSNTVPIAFNLNCKMASGAQGTVCLLFQSETGNPDGTVTYVLKARYTAGSVSSSVLTGLSVSTTVTTEPPTNTMNAILLNGLLPNACGSPCTAPPSWNTDSFSLTTNVDQTLTYTLSFGTGVDAAQDGLYSLSIVVVQ